MDGDQPGEGVIGKAQPLDEEVELGGPASVLHGVAQLPPAQHVDVALPKERVCKDRKEKMGDFREAVVVSNPFCLCTRCFHHPLCQSFSSAGGGNFIWQNDPNAAQVLAILHLCTRRVGKTSESLFWAGASIAKMFP